MHNAIRRSTVLAATAAIAFGVGVAPAAAKASKWTTSKCTSQAAHWTRAHRHAGPTGEHSNATPEQTSQENKLLAKHNCTNTV